MIKKLILGWLLFIGVVVGLLAGEVAAAPSLFGAWTDVWANGAYENTNFERNGFATYVLREDAKVGIYLVPLWGDTYLMPYVTAQGAYSGDPNYWNNNLYTGVGVRVLPFAKTDSPSPINALKIFYESLSASYYKDGEAAVAAGRPNQDTVFGLDLWYEWNQPQWSGDKNYSFASPWSEVWANLSFRQTNFYEDNFNSYILRIQEKTGLFLGEGQNNGPLFQPYLTFDFVNSGKNYSWLNRMSYGLGVRVEPFRFTDDPTSAWLFKLKMFGEGLGMAYFKDAPTTNISTDFRAGVEFTIGR
ncbi:MAG: hypothetical protein WC901_05355 [Candidatus Margulisiibacteriota bacterium]